MRARPARVSVAERRTNAQLLNDPDEANVGKLMNEHRARWLADIVALLDIRLVEANDAPLSSDAPPSDAAPSDAAPLQAAAAAVVSPAASPSPLVAALSLSSSVKMASMPALFARQSSESPLERCVCLVGRPCVPLAGSLTLCLCSRAAKPTVGESDDDDDCGRRRGVVVAAAVADVGARRAVVVVVVNRRARREQRREERIVALANRVGAK